MINAIPLEMELVLGVVIGPSIRSNEMLYANREGRQVYVHFHYQHMMSEWALCTRRTSCAAASI
jgi:hypothetical protein